MKLGFVKDKKLLV